MSLIDAVLSLAILVKKTADDAVANVELCRSLGLRVDLVPRLMEKISNPAELDEALIFRLFEILRSAQELVLEYNNRNKFFRILTASLIKEKFFNIEQSLGKCLDDLALCIGIASAAKLDFISNTLTSSIARTMETTESEMIPNFLIDYNKIQFESKRGIRKEIGSGHLGRVYMGTLDGYSIAIKEPIIVDENEIMTNEDIIEYKSNLLKLVKLKHPCICQVFGGGYEYACSDASEMVIQGVESNSTNTNSCNHSESLKFLVMEHVKNDKYKTVYHAITSELVHDLQDLFNIAIGVIFAIHHIHSVSLYHGNIDPNHILLNNDKCPKLTQLLHQNLFVTSQGKTGGSNKNIQYSQWTSPEVVKGGSSLCASLGMAGDVYSFGLLLSFLFGAQMPYDPHFNSYQIAEALRTNNILPSISPRVPIHLQEMVQCSLSADSSSRPSSLSILRMLVRAAKDMKLNNIIYLKEIENVLMHGDNISAISGNGIIDKTESDVVFEEGVALSEFDDMFSQVENYGSTSKIFNLVHVENSNSLKGCGIASNDRLNSCVAIYGDKIIVSEFLLNCDQQALYDDDDDEEELAHDDQYEKSYKTSRSKVVLQDAGMKSEQKSDTFGTIIFHIDNTTSMTREHRMDITKSVLLRVLPNFIRQGFKIIINSWAINMETKGKIQSKELVVDGALLDAGKEHELEAFLQSVAFEYLVPNGRTDLYGSMYQLFQQSRRYLMSGPVHAFVLTDGNHNVIGFPLHKPSVEEDCNYFDMYQFNLSDQRWKKTDKDWTVHGGQEYLKDAYFAIHTTGKEGQTDNNLALTLIGIGDAETTALSELSKALGENCTFYGITEVNQCHNVFKSVNLVNEDDTLKILFGDSCQLQLKYSYREGDSMSGCVILSENALLPTIHSSEQVIVGTKKQKGTLYRCVHTHLDSQVEEIIQDLVMQLRSIRSIGYNVTENSFQDIFKKLLSDKSSLKQLKSSFYSRQTRKYRSKYPIFSCLSIWLRELEDLIDGQINSYRMNVEEDLLKYIASSNDSKKNDSDLDIQQIAPSKLVLDRLQNNLNNVGGKIHRVKRHINSVQQIRDRSIHLSSKMMAKHMRITVNDITAELSVLHGKSSKEDRQSWLIELSSITDEELVKQEFRSIFNPLSLSSSSGKYSAADENNRIEDILCFPCILLKAKFDVFSIVHATPQFFTENIFHFSSENNNDILRCNIYCAQELWELCNSGEFTPGDALPVDCPLSVTPPNMILSLGHTPLLFRLFKERGRAYQSGINVTGDCMSLTAVSYQWGKFFHDTILSKTAEKFSSRYCRLSILEGIKSIVSFSYAIEDSIIPPSCDSLISVFACDVDDSSYKSCGSDFKLENITKCPVISRDVFAGLTCPVGIAALVAGGDMPYASNPHSWNLMITTLFSRMCESISGHKVVRNSVQNAESNVKDLGELEESYRYKIGELQSILQLRLHVEWSQSTWEAKLAAVKTHSSLILKCLNDIITNFLQLFSQYHLTPWRDILTMLHRAMCVRNYGISKIRMKLQNCSELYDLVDHMLDVNFDKTTSLTLPFAYEVVSKEISDTKFIAFRELEVTDIAALVYFIDSIVATKASPKIKYVRVLNPAYPTFSTSTHDALKFTFDRSPFNPNLPCASVAFIGNVNSGKSSIGGHLLELLNVVPQNVVHRLGEEAKKIGYSEDIKHAWVLDRTKDARTKGRTLDSTYVGFQTPTRRFTTIDNPGHKDYSKNSTIGIFHADIVVLVTSVVMSEIELAEISRSQAEEHLVTSFCFGVRQIIVAINKMDLVNYSQSCFETVKKHMLKHILKAGFKANQVTYVPVSGTNGDCLLSDSANMPWYSGASLLQAMDEAPLPPRHVEKQFRLVVEETRNIKGIGHVVCGRVERGKITTGDIFKLYPNGPEGRVVSIESHHRQTDTGFPGDDIGISFRNVGGKSKSNQESPIVRGMIAGLTCNPPVAVMQRFEAQILLLRGAPIKVGYAPTLTMHLNLIQVTFVRLIEVIDRNNTSIEKNPESASVGQTFICELECIRPVAAETIHDAPRLSRFMIKEMRVIRALGFIRAKLA